MDTRRALNSAKRGRDPSSHRNPKDEMKLYNQGAKNASRDVRRRFVSLGLSLPIRISHIKHDLKDGATITHWVKPTDWIRTLLGKCPHALLGDYIDFGLQLESFWHFYKQHHPDHEVFKHHINDLRHTIPLSLFGDEGRGPKRGNFLIWSIESTLGLGNLPKDWKCNCANDLAKLPKTDLLNLPTGSGQSTREEVRLRAEKQMTNMKGHSYVTRHLIFGIPHWLYKNEKEEVLEEHLTALSNDMCDLFWNGVEVDGSTFFGALIAIKGDMKHHLSFGLNRSYHKLQGGMMCSLCEAGGPGIPFESHVDEPPWSTTMYASRPWDDAPTITKIPYDSASPERAFALDAFHLFKVGMGRDLSGSMIVYLARAGFFDEDSQLELMYKLFVFKVFVFRGPL